MGRYKQKVCFDDHLCESHTKHAIFIKKDNELWFQLKINKFFSEHIPTT